MIELNRSRNNVVLSRRAVLEEERKEVRQQILDRLQPGQVVEGAISNIVDFGAFVDLDGIDGLIHISELSWSHVNHPSEILSIGDTVPVKVLDIDRDRQRISLGLKQTQEDPWQRVVDTYKLGDELEGKVTKVVTFGAFVEILDGVEGLVHISELAHHHVENPREVVEPGDEVKVKILEIDSERRRLSLSVKRVRPLQRAAAAASRAAPAGPGRGSRRRCATSASPTTCSPGPTIVERGCATCARAVAAAEEAEPAAEALPSRRGGGRRASRACGRGARRLEAAEEAAEPEAEEPPLPSEARRGARGRASPLPSRSPRLAAEPKADAAPRPRPSRRRRGRAAPRWPSPAGSPSSA